MTVPIVVGVALRDDDAAPLALGGALAAFMAAPLALAHVPPAEPPSRVPVLAYDTERRERALARVQELADPIGATAHVVTASSPVDGLHEAAATLDAAVLVVGSSHRGPLGRVMPGGVGERLLHDATCAVALAPRGYAGGPIRSVGAAFVDTEEGRDALTAAATMAALGELPLAVFNAIEPGEAAGIAERQQRVHALLPEGMHATVHVTGGDPVDVLEQASRTVDLLVCGSRGRGPLRTIVLGGVSGRLAHRAASPLIVLPRTPSAIAAGGTGQVTG